MNRCLVTGASGFVGGHIAERLIHDGWIVRTGLPIVILRPGFVYGPRDRTILPRIIKNLRRGLVTYFGSPAKKLNQIYVGNIADACVLALEKSNVSGGVYNIRDAELVTKEH